MQKKLELIMGVCLIAAALFAATHGVNAALSARAVEGMKVVIDAGHGGVDPGKVAADGSLEKDINLEIALVLGEYLKEQGMEVYYTRQEDMGLYSASSTSKKAEDLKKRCAIIENVRPDVTISIHQNSYGESYVKGAQVFYFSQSEAGKILAEAIQENIRKSVDRENSREAKANDSYYILKNTVSPTVIVECGFLSNPGEAEKLQEPSYQKKLAKAIGQGICDYRGTSADGADEEE